MEIEISPNRGMTDARTMDARRVSVVIPAYNASSYLAATLQSICHQFTPPGQVIVVDDGSTDDTAAIARTFTGVTVISVPNGGPAAARNAGTWAATGDIIAYLDADDLWPPNKLEAQLCALQEYGAPAFSFTDCRVFDERGFYKRNGELRREWAFRKVAGKRLARHRILIADDGKKPLMYDISYILPSSVLVRRADVLAIKGFDETLRYGEDYDFFLRLFAIVPAIVLLEPLLYYRRHAGQATMKTAASMKASFFHVARRVAAAPERYPSGDVRYIAQTDYLRHFRMAILYARLGQIDETIRHLKSSLALRWTSAAWAFLIASRICAKSPGRDVLGVARTLWRMRPGRR